jgi:hypothetical protein
MPEAPHLELGKRYRQHLEDLFRGALALIRESHAKQSGGGRGGYCGTHEQPIWIYPSLTIEPLPWLYARRAASYRFVQLVLKEEFGAGTLQELHRLTLDGQNRASLAEELNWIQKLFDGAAATAAQELGLEPADGSEDARRCFAEWREKQGEDPDVKGDARMMVPVFYDIERRMTKVWALLGWRTVSVTVDYRVPPTVLAVEPAQPSEAPPRRPPPVQFRGERFEFAEPVMAEVYVEKLLDRDEFRRHCGRYQTRSAILANLQ